MGLYTNIALILAAAAILPVHSFPSSAPYTLAEDAILKCAEPNSEGTLLVHEECSKFYQCSHGAAVTHQCYGDLVFNPSTKQCDWAEKVDCSGRKIAKEIESQNNRENPLEICEAEDSEGLLASHPDCDKFYQCSHGRPVEHKCPEDLLYDPAIGKCQWSDQVDCGDRNRPNSL